MNAQVTRSARHCSHVWVPSCHQVCSVYFHRKFDRLDPFRLSRVCQGARETGNAAVPTVGTCTVPYVTRLHKRRVLVSLTGLSESEIKAFLHCLFEMLVHLTKTDKSSGLSLSRGDLGLSALAIIRDGPSFPYPNCHVSFHQLGSVAHCLYCLQMTSFLIHGHRT